jgi:hypothetical protein
LSQRNVWAFFSKHRIQTFNKSPRKRAQALIWSHQLELNFPYDAKSTQYLIEHFMMLTSGRDNNLSPSLLS